MTVTTSSLTKAQFLKRANAICNRGAEEVAPKIAQALEATDASAEATTRSAAAAFLPMVEGVVAEVGELGAPEGDLSQVQVALDALQRATNAAKESPVSSMEQLAQIFKRQGTLASRYGLDDCAYG